MKRVLNARRTGGREVKGMSFIELHQLTHIYQQGMEHEHKALDAVDLQIEAGEFVAILGANGSGKSTLAKHLNALLLPTSGHVIVAGMDTLATKELWQIRQQVGMVFQNPDNQIIAQVIVEDDVAFGPENLGVPTEELPARVTEALRTVGMQHYRSCAPHLLSGGQKQRVAIAGALAMQTKCLVLDEPTAMLDPQGRADILACVKKLHEERGITIVYITHFMEEAAAADRIVVMDQGHIVTQGTPHEIFSQTAAMRKLGLEVPVAAELAAELRQHGVHLPASIITAEELAAALSGEV